MTAEALATEALRLQGQGAHNINFVSPSHVLPQMVEAISLAAAQGLAVPVVCNCNAYETSDSLRKMEGFVDIYLPDLKYTRAQTAATLSGGPDYPSVALESMKEMYRQVGPLQTDESGVARSGVIVRHLVLPGRVDESLEVLETLRRHFGRGIALSLMAQYYPAHLADDSNGLHRRLTGREYRTIVDAAQNLGLDDLWTQEPSSAGHYRPDFHQHHPFEF